MVELPTVVPRIDDRDWSKLSLGDRIRQLEVEGYVLIPDMLSPDQIGRIKAQVETLKTMGMDYSERQRTASQIMFMGGEVTELAAHPATMSFLKTLLGDDLICWRGDYARSEPGHPGMAIHTDAGGGTAPHVTVRVLYYLNDLTPKRSPFRVIPHSHLSLHAEGNYFTRYHEHPDETMVTAKAGSAVFINHRVFHGNYPNRSDKDREMVAYAYRPGWCGPPNEMPQWDADKVAALPEHVRELFRDPNTHYDDFSRGNRPPGMAHDARGLSPDRWELA